MSSALRSAHRMRFALVVALHRQAADEVGEEDERLALQLRVLVVVVVDVPRLVADHDVVVLGLEQVDEGHEVVGHDLVHRAQREERLQVVLAGHALEVPALVGQALRDRVQPLAFVLEVARGRVDGEPVDRQIGLQLAQLARDRQVALRVAEADRARDEQRLALALHRAHPGALGRCTADEVAQRAVEDHRIARRGHVAAAADGEQLGAGHQRLDLLALDVRHAPVVVAVDHQRRARDAARQFAHIVVEPRVASPIDHLGIGGPADSARRLRTAWSNAAR